MPATPRPRPSRLATASVTLAAVVVMAATGIALTLVDAAPKVVPLGVTFLALAFAVASLTRVVRAGRRATTHARADHAGE